MIHGNRDESEDVNIETTVHYCPDGTIIIEHDFGDDEVIRNGYFMRKGLCK